MVANKAISVKDITKKYGESKAVDGVSFEVDEGEIFGFIGPNDADKTTTVRILAILLPSSSGEANVLGFDVNKDSDKIRRRIGYVQQQFSVEFFMTVRGNLDTYAHAILSFSIETEREEEHDECSTDACLYKSPVVFLENWGQ